MKINNNNMNDLGTLRTYLPDYLKKITKNSRKAGKNMFDCPICHSGTGRNGTGALSITDNGEKWKCFACGCGGDIFDFVGEVEGISEFSERVKFVCDFAGVPYISGGAYSRDNYKKPQQKNSSADEETDLTEFLLQANSHLEDTNYHRGISLDTLNKYHVGYCKEWINPKAPNVPATSRLIIPTSKFSYLARATESLDDKNREKIKVGKTHFFNIQALEDTENAQPIYIVEGELDALSIIDIGGIAIGLGSTSMKNQFVKMLQEKKPDKTFFVALDNDTAGNKAADELMRELDKLDIKCVKVNPYAGNKDANETLVVGGRENFKRLLKEAEETAFNAIAIKEVEKKEKKAAELEEYRKNSSGFHLQEFLNGIADSINTPYISTGFNNLDNVLDGGLYEGLYCIGAISSLGKTTFIEQMADYIAMGGTDVLYFSLEMSRSELMSKSISRLTLEQVMKNNPGTHDFSLAKTSRGITTAKRYLNYSDEEKALIAEAANAYGDYANHIYITEGIGDVGVKEIREAVEKHIHLTGTTPVVIIDYLQIIAPYNDRATDKQNIDKAVLELKRISRDFKLPVIIVSSVNRESYSEPISMKAFKESGAIEFTADVLIGLQLAAVSEKYKNSKGKLVQKPFDADVEKKKNPREIELVILKNRNGKTGDKLRFDYYTLFNYFAEVQTAAEETA